MLTQLKSTLKRQSSIISMQSSNIGSQSKLKNRQQIDNLISKFNDLNSHIEIDADHTNFNLIEYERGNQKIKYDPQMMTAKLRKLENRAQIKRAQMEIQNREKKKSKRIVSKNKKEDQTYQIIYQKFLKNNKIQGGYEGYHSEDQSNDENDANPKSISFFNKLKMHPKLLNYTLKKLEDKSCKKDEKQKQILERLQNHKMSRQIMTNDYKQLAEQMSQNRNLNLTYNPQSVVDSQSSKFYSKKSSENINKQIAMLPRCHKMMQRQNRILADIGDKSLSKQNKKKLKNRMNQIIINLGKSQKTRNTLPKIESARNKGS